MSWPNVFLTELLPVLLPILKVSCSFLFLIARAVNGIDVFTSETETEKPLGYNLLGSIILTC